MNDFLTTRLAGDLEISSVSKMPEYAEPNP